MKKSIDIRPLVRQADKSVRKGYNVPLVATHQEFSAGHASDTLTVACSDAIKNAMDHIHENNLSLPQSATIKRLSGNKFYFDEYHTSLKEAFDIIANNLNI